MKSTLVLIRNEMNRIRFGSSDSPTHPKCSCTHLCSSDENNTSESPLKFVTRPTCRNSCTLPDRSRGLYFRIGMTPPGAFTVVPRRTAPDPLLTLSIPQWGPRLSAARVHATINRCSRSTDRKRRTRAEATTVKSVIDRAISERTNQLGERATKKFSRAIKRARLKIFSALKSFYAQFSSKVHMFSEALENWIYDFHGNSWRAVG